MPTMFKSLVLERIVVGETLVDRGHDVYALMDSAWKDLNLIQGGKVKPIFYTEPSDALNWITIMDGFKEAVFKKTLSHDTNIDPMVEIGNKICSRILHNNDLVKEIAEHNFNLAIVDGDHYQACSFFIPHHLSIPYVYMFSFAPVLSLGVPALPSFTNTLYDTVFVPRTFREKVNMILSHMEIRRIPGVTSIWDIILKCELFIITSDHILEEAGPSLPNTLFLPGITTRPASPLPGNINALLESTSTVVLMSFGSTIDDMPEHLLLKLLQGFAAVKNALFLVRISDKSTATIKDKIPSNVRTLGWIPQQDILAHPHTKLFITHCS